MSVIGIILVCFAIAVIVGVAGTLMRQQQPPDTGTDIPISGDDDPPPPAAR